VSYNIFYLVKKGRACQLFLWRMRTRALCRSACSLVSLLCEFRAFSGGPGQALGTTDEWPCAAIAYPVAYRSAAILSAILLSRMVYRTWVQLVLAVTGRSMLRGFHESSFTGLLLLPVIGIGITMIRKKVACPCCQIIDACYELLQWVHPKAERYELESTSAATLQLPIS
jgi:hypothetical protein